jgi:hypothetical protein
MRPVNRGVLIALLSIGFATPASAQDRPHDRTTPNAASPATPPATLTGKERLGRKWMDEQRIDNCNVPIDKRGARPRPSTCAHGPTRGKRANDRIRVDQAPLG